jgi:hypothetical protein
MTVAVVQTATWPLVGVPVFETLPPLEIVLQPKPVPEVQIKAFVAPEHDGTARPEGVVAVNAPRTVLAVCVARFAFGRFPVTPVESGNPVALVRTPEAGVPSAGVTSTGDVASTGLPVPVAVTPLRTVELVHTPTCPLVGVPVLLTLPPPEGVAQVASPRQNVVDDAAVPPFRFATGRLPVTPVDSGKPVAFASVIVGPVANTSSPVPVSFVTAAARFAEDGVARNVATPAASPDTPVDIGRPVALLSVPEAGVPRVGVVKVGLVSVNPAIVVVVLPVAIDVDPIVIGNPEVPPQLPAVHIPPAPTTQSPLTGTRPPGEAVELERTISPEAGHVTPPLPPQPPHAVV